MFALANSTSRRLPSFAAFLTIVCGFLAGTAHAGGLDDCACAADFDQSGIVDGGDLGALLGTWGSSSAVHDLNLDGIVNGADLGALLGVWGPCTDIAANQTCATAIDLASLSGSANDFCTVGGFTSGPSLPLSAACHKAGFTQISSDLWYTFHAPFNGTMRVGVCANDFDSKIAVYGPAPLAGPCVGEIGGPSFLACNDDLGAPVPLCPNPLSSALFAPMVAGGKYFVRIGGHAGSEGTGTLDINTYLTGDLCIDCITIPCSGGSCSAVVSGSTVGMTNWPPIAASCGSGFDGGDAWFCITPQCTGASSTLVISSCNAVTDFDTLLSVHTGGCDGLVQVACNDDATLAACGLSGTSKRKARVSVTVTPGQTYWVRLTGVDGATGNYELTFSEACP